MVKALVLATTNRKKIEEIERILGAFSIPLLTPANFPKWPDIEENGNTFEENALIKARAVYKLTGTLALADDSGIEVEALGGRPGIFSARYAGEPANDKNNYEKLLFELQGQSHRTARFQCSLALVGKNIERTFDGTCEGWIADFPRGQNGFGYDPIFYVPELQMTMAELPDEIKNTLSHRARALEKFQAYFLAHFI